MYNPLLAIASICLFVGFVGQMLLVPIVHAVRPHVLVGYGCAGTTAPIYTYGEEDTLPLCKRIERVR